MPIFYIEFLFIYVLVLKLLQIGFYTFSIASFIGFLGCILLLIENF